MDPDFLKPQSDAFLQNCTAPADIDLSYFLLFLRFLGLGTMLNSLGVGMSMVPQDSWFRKGRKTAASLRFCFLRGSQDLEHW